MKKRMIVLSLDSMGTADENEYLEHEAIQSIIKEGVYLRNLRSVTPTLTYPAHTSLITGRYPSSHGIVNNIKLEPNKDEPDWFWYARDIKGDTLFSAARRARKKVGSIFWPVNAGGRVSWNIAEIWPHRSWHNAHSLVLAYSSKRFAMRMNREFSHLLDGKKQPNLDDFAFACGAQIVAKEDFDLLFIHFTDVDTHKHKYGTDSVEVKDAIERTDDRIRAILDILDYRGILEETDIVCFSDHNQVNIDKALKINQIFYRHGLLNVQNDKVTKWRAYANTAQGSAFIYMRRDNSKLEKFIFELLRDIRRIYGGIDRIYTREEAIALGADPNCTFYLTAEKGTVFSNSLSGDILDDVEDGYKANHGYPPNMEGNEVFFMAKGPSFKEGALISDSVFDITDIGATLAKAAGLDLKDPQGKIIEAILR